MAHGNIPAEYMSHDNPLLQQKMKPRHLQMIAVGGSIGTGLFVRFHRLSALAIADRKQVGSGKALGTGGPAGILLAGLSWVSC